MPYKTKVLGALIEEGKPVYSWVGIRVFQDFMETGL